MSSYYGDYQLNSSEIAQINANRADSSKPHVATAFNAMKAIADSEINRQPSPASPFGNYQAREPGWFDQLYTPGYNDGGAAVILARTGLILQNTTYLVAAKRLLMGWVTGYHTPPPNNMIGHMTAEPMGPMIKLFQTADMLRRYLSAAELAQVKSWAAQWINVGKNTSDGAMNFPWPAAIDSYGGVFTRTINGALTYAPYGNSPYNQKWMAVAAAAVTGGATLTSALDWVLAHNTSGGYDYGWDHCIDRTFLPTHQNSGANSTHTGSAVAGEITEGHARESVSYAFYSLGAFIGIADIAAHANYSVDLANRVSPRGWKLSSVVPLYAAWLQNPNKEASGASRDFYGSDGDDVNRQPYSEQRGHLELLYRLMSPSDPNRATLLTCLNYYYDANDNRGKNTHPWIWKNAAIWADTTVGGSPGGGGGGGSSSGIVARTNYADVANGSLDPLWVNHGRHMGTGCYIGAEADPLGGSFRCARYTVVDGGVFSGGERAETLNTDALAVPNNGGRFQVGFKLLLPTGFSASASDWNGLAQMHYNGAIAQSPWMIGIKNTGDLFYRTIGGPLNGDGTMGTVQNLGVIGSLTRNVWHTVCMDVRLDVSDGIFDLWLDGTQILNLRASTLSPAAVNSAYWKQGFYRSEGDSGSNSYYFQDTVWWEDTSPDAMLAYFGLSTPPPTPPPGAALPPNTRQRRFGASAGGSVSNGNSDGYKSGSKFATGLTGSEEADVKDVHVYCLPGDNSTATQGLTVGLYADDGGSGEPGTKFGESQEILLPGNVAAGWQKIILPSPIRVTGANCWILVGAGSPTNRVWYAGDSVVGGLRYGLDVYELSPPRLSAPAGAMSSADILRSLAADYDVVTGSPPPTPGDTDPPGVSSMSISLATLHIDYDEPLLPSSIPFAIDYTVTVDGSTRSISAVSISGSTVILALSESIAPAVSVSLSYTQVSGRQVKDVAGNLAPNFSALPVANNTTPPTGPARTLTIARVIDPSRRVAGTRNVDGLGGGV